jgi:transglutaminase-like putative cysteine protease
MKRILLSIIGIVVVVGLVWILQTQLNAIGDPGQNPSHYSIPKQIHFSFTLQNTTARVIKTAEFWTYVPVKQTATQKTVHISSSHPYRLIADNASNQLLHFTFTDLPPYAAKIIMIKTDLLLTNKMQPLPEDQLQRYLGPEEYIESDDADIIRLAQKLKASDSVTTARYIFDWVAENVRYAGYVRNTRGARYALIHKKGDCTEFANLFVALCRADRIPARGIGGYVLKDSAVIKPTSYHNWAEFYDDGVWHTVDPQNKLFMPERSDYIATRIIHTTAEPSSPGFRRFGFKGDGLTVKMQ